MINAIALALAAALGVASSPHDFDTELADAAESCVGVLVFFGTLVEPDDPDVPSIATELGEPDFKMFDDGHSVLMNARDAYLCLADRLGLPRWTYELMVRTTSEYGLVDVTVGAYRILWSYDPDNGPLVIVVDADAA